MKKKNSIVKIGAALSVIFVLLLAGCASTGGGSTGPGKQAAASAAPVSSPVYYGSGSGATQTEAMNQAKIAAVRKASADLLGVAAAAAKRDEIETALFGKGGVNAYVYNDSMEIIDRGGSDGDFSLTLGIKINLESVAAVLRGAGIYGGQVYPRVARSLLSISQGLPFPLRSLQPPKLPLPPDRKKFLKRRLLRLPARSTRRKPH